MATFNARVLHQGQLQVSLGANDGRAWRKCHAILRVTALSLEFADDANAELVSIPCDRITSTISLDDAPSAQATGFTVQTKQMCIYCATTSVNEQRQWLDALARAQRLACGVQPDLAFVRFAASDSEESECDSLQDAQVTSPCSPTTVRRGTLSKSSPLVLTIVQVTAIDDDGTEVYASIPLSTNSLSEVTVSRVKADALGQMKKKLGTGMKELEKHEKMSKRFFVEIQRREADWFGLHLKEKQRWLQNEGVTMGHVLSDTSSRLVHMELLPASMMPPPTLHIEISSTKAKVSDLSQRSYTAYVIDVTFKDLKWQATRRYKEFAKLHEQLRAKYESNSGPTSSEQRVALPKLPPKTLLASMKSEFVNKRRIMLEQYLNDLVSHASFSQDVLVLSFLGMVSTSRDPVLSKNEKNVVHITSLHQCLQYGDILLFSCRFNASVVQRKFTGKRYDHVGMVVPGISKNLLRIMEATGEGIQVYSLKARLMAYAREVSKHIVVRRVHASRTDKTYEQINEFVKRVEGNSYSIFGILNARGESARIALDKESPRRKKHRRKRGRRKSMSSLSHSSGSDNSPRRSSFTSTEVNSGTHSDEKRKYFCSSLVASALKELGWLVTNRSCSYFWPGSFEDGGEVEQYLADGVHLSPETVIDCRIVEVGLATQEEKNESPSSAS